MKKILTLFVVFSSWCLTDKAFAQNAEMEAQMKAWTAYMTPGNEHKQMSSGVGEWKAATKMWMDPSQPPMMMDAMVTNEMILGGRYMVSRYKGQMMGMPFEGISTMGYDNATKKYVSSWVDNMGTGMMYMEGKWREDIKGIEFTGNGVDPQTGKEIPMRQLFMIKDDNMQTMEMYENRNGKEMKTMEMTLSKM